MDRWQRVLLLIAIPFSLVQVAGLYIDWAYPRAHDAFVSSFAMQDLPRLVVYWTGGFVFLLLGVT